MTNPALAGHAGDMSPTAISSLMPHEIALLIAGMGVVLLLMAGVLWMALRRISRLERRISSLETRTPPPG